MSLALASRTPFNGPHPIADRDFRAIQVWMLRETGIHLTDAKRQLLVGRLWRRVKDLGLPDYGAYLRLATDGPDPEERARFINALCTHETQFFREPRQFEYLQQTLIPRWQREAAEGRRSRQVRVWSSACSSGEEPYSLAMCLLADLRAEDGWRVEVHATDLSSAVLAKAQAGIYPMTRAEQIPEGYLKRFFLKGRGAQEGKCAVGPALRAAVTFQELNLQGAWPALGKFDLILCRNVLIYFDGDGRRKVLGRLIDHLTPEGQLFLGHAESLNGSGHVMRSILPTIYAHPTRGA
jgi:chemotaxis protein methyltransferase CheR